MTTTTAKMTIEELLPMVRLANIQKISSFAERYGDKPIIGALLNSGVGNEIIGSVIFFRIDYQLILKCELVDEKDTMGVLSSSVVVAYETSAPAHPQWKESASILEAMATLAGHPYLRQSISLLASELNFPSVTIGLLRRGSSMAESVVIGDRVFPFTVTPYEGEQQRTVQVEAKPTYPL